MIYCVNFNRFGLMQNRHLRLTSKMAVFCFVLEHHLDGKAAAKEVGVRPIHVWWSRGESNPCPKATWKELLRVQFVIYIPSSRRKQTSYGNQ